jgi:hypothetical protein
VCVCVHVRRGTETSLHVDGLTCANLLCIPLIPPGPQVKAPATQVNTQTTPQGTNTQVCHKKLLAAPVAGQPAVGNHILLQQRLSSVQSLILPPLAFAYISARWQTSVHMRSIPLPTLASTTGHILGAWSANGLGQATCQLIQLAPGPGSATLIDIPEPGAALLVPPANHDVCGCPEALCMLMD